MSTTVTRPATKIWLRMTMLPSMHERPTFASMLLQHDNNYNDEPMGVRNMPIYEWFTHRMNHNFSLHSCNVARVNLVNMVERWIVDSGAMAHITNSDLHLTLPQSVSIKVMIGNGKEIVCIKWGNVLIKNGGQTLQLKRVLFAPTFMKNIISLGLLLCTNSRADNAVVTMPAHEKSLKTMSADNLKFNTNDGVLFYLEGIQQHPMVSKVFNSETMPNLMSTRFRSVHTSAYQCHTFQTLPGNSKIPLSSPPTSFPLPTDAPTHELPSTRRLHEIFPTSVKNTVRDTICMDINEAHAKYGHISEQALHTTMQLVHVKPTGKLCSCNGCAIAVKNTVWDTICMDINEAHAKYGHISEQALHATMQLVHVKPTGKLCSCNGCAIAKANKATKISPLRLSGFLWTFQVHTRSPL